MKPQISLDFLLVPLNWHSKYILVVLMCAFKLNSIWLKNSHDDETLDFTRVSSCLTITGSPCPVRSCTACPVLVLPCELLLCSMFNSPLCCRKFYFLSDQFSAQEHSLFSPFSPPAPSNWKYETLGWCKLYFWNSWTKCRLFCIPIQLNDYFCCPCTPFLPSGYLSSSKDYNGKRSDSGHI